MFAGFLVHVFSDASFFTALLDGVYRRPSFHSNRKFQCGLRRDFSFDVTRDCSALYMKGIARELIVHNNNRPLYFVP